MKIRYLVLVLVAVAACGAAEKERPSEGGHEPQPVTLSPNLTALTKFSDQVHRPASEGPASVYNAARRLVESKCAAGDHLCRRSWIRLFAGADDYDPRASQATLNEWKSRWSSITNFYKQLNSDVEGFHLAARAMNTVSSAALTKQTMEIDRLGRAVGDAPGNVRRKILEKAEPIKGQQMTALAATRQLLIDLKTANDAYQKAVEPHLATFSGHVEAFARYRGGEAAAMATLTSLANAASSADLDRIATLIEQVRAVSRTENDAAGEIIVAARRLEKLLELAHRDYARVTDRFAAAMKSAGLRPLDLSSKPIKVLLDMVGYAEAREKHLGEGVARLTDGLRTRREALIARAKDAATRETLRQASHLAASGAFLNDINDQIAVLGRVPPRGTRLGLSFLTQQHRDHMQFLELEKVCQTPSGWMADGCGIAQPSLAVARTFLGQKLPSVLRLQIAFLKRGGAPSALVAEAETQLAQGNLRGAVQSHDAALTAAEGGAP